jgi:hypothetical protein
MLTIIFDGDLASNVMKPLSIPLSFHDRSVVILTVEEKSV